MPLTRYQVSNEYSLADPELYKAADRDDPEALLEGVAMAGLVGVLRQLGDLAEFAAEIFHDLHEEVLATAARGHGLMLRVQQLEAEFPSIEKAFLSQTNPTSFYSNAGVDWHPKLSSVQNLITFGDLPRCVMDSYEECRGPPRLFLLDKFDVAGAGACLKRYTDPSFFKVETAPSEPSVEVHREKKFRKVKKKGSRWKNGETPEIIPTSHAKLHQLFLEESVEKGRSDPARLVKLKKRHLNASLFDPRSGKSYMEKFLETPPDLNEIREISVNPLPLKRTPDNSSESGLEIYEITAVSPVKETLQGKENTCLSTNAHEVVLTPSMHELYGEVTDRQIVKVPEPSADGERDENLSIHHKVMVEKDIAVDGEGKREGSMDGDNSDDMTSEVDNYMDALTTMESELEIDHEYRPKSDCGFSNIEKHGICDRNGEQLESETQFSDSHSIGNFSASDDGNSSIKKGRSSFSYSDTLSNMAEISPYDGEGSAKVCPTSEAFIPENTETPPNQLFPDVHVRRTESHDLMLQNDMCISEDNINNLREAYDNSSLADSNHLLPPLEPATSSMQQQIDETPSESVEAGSTSSCTDERDTSSSAVLSDMPLPTTDGLLTVTAESNSVDRLNGGDPVTSSIHCQSDETPSESVKPGSALSYSHERESVLSGIFFDMPSQTRDSPPFTVSTENTSADRLDASDSHVVSYVSLNLSNNLERAPAEASSADIAEKSYPDNAENNKIGSPQSNIPPKEEQVPYSVLSEVEDSSGTRDVLAFEVVDAVSETEVYGGNSSSIGDGSQNCSFQEQRIPDVVDTVPQVELESEEETVPYSEEENIINTSWTADSKKIGAPMCDVDTVDGDPLSFELPSNYTDCPPLEGHSGVDDAVTESALPENMAVSSTATDDVPAEVGADDDVDVDADVVYPLQHLICSQSNDTVNSVTEGPLKDGLKISEQVSPDCLRKPDAENETTPREVAPRNFDSTSCELISLDESNSQMVSGVQNTLSGVTQKSWPAGDVIIPPTFSELSDEELELKHLNPTLLKGGENSPSSPEVDLSEPGTSSEQPLELHTELLHVEPMEPKPRSNSPNHLSQQVQSSVHTDQQRLVIEVSESCQEDLRSKLSPSEYLPQSSGQEINIRKQEMDPLCSVLPGFGLLPEAAQVNLEEMPPLPPLPPMQWRLGKIQQGPQFPQREFKDHSQESLRSTLPLSDQEKSQSVFSAQHSDSVRPANPLLPVGVVEFEKSFVSEQVGNLMQPTLSSLQFPFTVVDAKSQTISHDLEGTQLLNPFLTEKPDRCFLASEQEMVQSNSDPFPPLPSVEDTASEYDPLSSSEKLIHSLNQSAPGIQNSLENLEHENPSDSSVLQPRKVVGTAKDCHVSSGEKLIHPQSASEPALELTSVNLEEGHENPSDTSVLPPRKLEDVASVYGPISSPEKLIYPQSASEAVLEHTSENLEGEGGNPSDTSLLPPRKVEDASRYDPVSSPEKPILPLNKSASEPVLQYTSEYSEEHGNPSDASVLASRKFEEQSQHGLPSLEGESAWPSNPFSLQAISEVGQKSGRSIVKLPRLRSPLIDAVAAHDRSKLRKVTERVRPQSEPNVDERNSLLEQIRTKSFNLKPAVVSRPSIQGPKTNLRVAAILEKANAIRQATAGSNEDDDEDWSDS